MFAPWAYHKMLTLCPWEAKDGAALWAFAIDMSFSVSDLIFVESEKSAEFLIFHTSLGNVP